MSREEVQAKIDEWAARELRVEMALADVMESLETICEETAFRKLLEDCPWSVEEINLNDFSVELSGVYGDEYAWLPLKPKYRKSRTPKEEHPRIQWWWLSVNGVEKDNLLDIGAWADKLGIRENVILNHIGNSVSIFDSNGATPNPGDWIVYNPDTEEFYFE